MGKLTVGRTLLLAGLAGGIAVAAVVAADSPQSAAPPLREYNGSTFVRSWTPIAGTPCFSSGNRRLTPSNPAACVAAATTTTGAATTAPPVTTVPPGSTTSTSSTTTTTAAPATTTTTPPVSGRFTETFSDLSHWKFAHRRYEMPANSDAPSTATAVNGAAQIVAFDQNYGDATLRSDVKYDLTNGGVVTLDISDDANGDSDVLLGDAYIMLSANPDDAKAQMADERPAAYDPAAMPADALTIRLSANCRVPWAPPVAVKYGGGDRVTQRGNCATATDGKLRLVFTPGHVSVRNGADVEIVAYDVTVPPTGWVVLGVHNHASVKYGNQPAVTGLFDNVSYPTSSAGPGPTTTTTTSTTVPGSTTTTPPIVSTTTTVPGPTTTSTTVPPSQGGLLFTEDFTTDSRNRFDWRLQSSFEPPTGSFLGQHDMACGPPTTYRNVNLPYLQWGIPHSNVDVTNSELVWWCAPGNDVAKGHMMTGLDTGSIATLSFSPKESFTDVTKVCWDQNMDNLGDAKWVNVFVVPASDVAKNGGDLAYADGLGLPFGGIPQMLPPGAFDFDWIRGSIHGYKIDQGGNYNLILDQWKSYSPGGIATESASRYTICLDSGAGRVTLERPDGTVDSYPLGSTFPTGPVRVIWQDASYNPTKHEGATTSLTWHWDNIQITGASRGVIPLSL